jgi:hypothetical protein
VRFRRLKSPEATTNKARARVHGLGTPEILLWADTAGAAIARSLSDYQRAGSPDSLEDAFEGLLTMLGVVEELRARS